MFKYGVYSFDGAIGISGTTLVKSFDVKDDAKKCMRGYKATLSPNEKRYTDKDYKVRMYRVGNNQEVMV
tara:strand:+ start:53 stop:259 length:207 start_codon:yes stop_codon:yes gene_type:complete